MGDLLRWSKKDKGPFIQCVDGNIIKGCNIHENKQGSLIRTNKKLSNFRRFYFEVLVLERGEKCDVAFGLTKNNISSDYFPGYESGENHRHSLYRNNGKIYHGMDILVEKSEGFEVGDTVGCLIKSINIENDIVYKGQFIRNGEEVGLPWYLENDRYYPTLAINHGNAIVTTNFGENVFMLKGKDF